MRQRRGGRAPSTRTRSRALPRGGVARASTPTTPRCRRCGASGARRAGAARGRTSRSTSRADVTARCTPRARRQRRSRCRHLRGDADVALAVPGAAHGRSNALAAATAALAAGVPLDAIVRGLEAFRAGAPAGLSARARSRGAPIIDDTLQRESRLGARGDRRARARRRDAMARAGRHGRSRARRVRRSIARSAPTRARAGIERLYAVGALAMSERRSGVRRRRAGTSPTSTRLPRRVAQRTRAGDDGARQGLALHADGARRRGAHRRDARGGGALMLLWLDRDCSRRTSARSTCSATSRCARCWRRMTALVISFVVGPRMIAWLTRMKIGQSVRDDGPQTHLDEGRHADDGRRADPRVDRDHDAAVGRPRRTASSGSCCCVTLGFGADRLGRRLPQRSSTAIRRASRRARSSLCNR